MVHRPYREGAARRCLTHCLNLPTRNADTTKSIYVKKYKIRGGSRRLEQIVSNLYLSSVRYRMPSLSKVSTAKARDLMVEHGAIADAALARNTTLAIKLLTAHYRLTAKLLTLAHSDRIAQVEKYSRGTDRG
ncbi:MULTISPECIES: FCD domain-containing protein [unclassified Sulfitobacter]|uniref:FCD domain-containing protein n=1 Tax=unclassified Sulfitobacter TaxID=196795 RepID=UPI0037463B5E